VNKHLYLCHLLVLSSPTLMMHGHTNLKFPMYLIFLQKDVISRGVVYTSFEGSELISFMASGRQYLLLCKLIKVFFG
jgi:hypothetical protein